MNTPERGQLLLCSAFREGERPLTTAQYRELSNRVQTAGFPEGDLNGQLDEKELLRLGYEPEEAEQILRLLAREARLDQILDRARRLGIEPLPRLSADYPQTLIRKLGMNCPPVLYARGDIRLLRSPCVSLVGSRELSPDGRAFAQRCGLLAAQEGYTLVSGGAEGADLTAQEACLQAGGQVIVFTAGRLTDCVRREKVLYLSESGFELPFSVPRAMSRNRLIHALGDKTLVAQCRFGVGGTWNGSLDNLRHRLSRLFVNARGGDGAKALCERGATEVEELTSLQELESAQLSLFE